ncbi:hypothetical protein GGI15_004076 [Coemansia interrupta]|uniref:beta-N-acetylhexosaminidase n=1 Tax=Coemansia interrupta TaxID=1126814 RepID=A0A9W8H9Y2_9FUNG|nr:hypothetical protein GGI15_004239 [Coemansia interrupta]KAJ2778787.1 hypothetical protein GGI15_004076 [Coemansia interrupta]
MTADTRKKQRTDGRQDEYLPSPMQIATPIDSPPVSIEVDIDGAPEEIRNGLRMIVEGHSVGLFERPGALHRWHVRFEQQDGLQAYSVTSRREGGAEHVTVRYAHKTQAFRALGQVLAAAQEKEETGQLADAKLAITETLQFETLALMLDCSRNGVMTVAAVHALERSMALMGYTMLQLYTEDTYKVAGEPFFGYLRGGYTAAELRSIDDYGFALGIEVVACIQTLGHMGQVLQWPRFAGVRDTSEVLLAGDAATYALLERMIDAAAGPLRSRRIHIGMDEAYGVGEGRYRAQNGARDGAEVFAEHLERVASLCRDRGLRPMIWSDMLFCLAAKSNALYAYYDASTQPPPSCMPEGVDLVFWDYYHTAPDVYACKIRQHREITGSAPWVAGGAWTWSRMWCHLPFSLASTRASLAAAKQARAPAYMLTIWGDEGNECDFFSALPAMLYAAQHAYAPQDAVEVDGAALDRAFAAICGGSLAAWLQASSIDDLQPMDTQAAHVQQQQLPSNMSKWILWEDPLLAFLSPQYAGLPLEQHFAAAADQLLGCALADNPRRPLDRLLRLPGLLARVLSLKCQLRARLEPAYRQGDRAALLQVVETRLRPLIEAQRDLWLYHRARWHTIYKPFGWETLELRYGGLMARLQTVYDRLVAYCMRSSMAAALRRSRAIGVAAGVSRLPALVPATDAAGLCVGSAPTWLPPVAAAAPGAASPEASAALGWPLAATSAASAVSAASPALVAALPADTAAAGDPVLTSLPATTTTISALGVRELGGEGDFWLQPAPMLPPDLDVLSATPLPNIGCLGELDTHDQYTVDCIPELDEDLHCIYENAYTSLMLDYARVSAPSRLG